MLMNSALTFIRFTAILICFLMQGCCSDNPESVATKKLMESLKQKNCYAMHGWIQKQGHYTLADASPRLTVCQAILRAGGFASTSDKRHVVVRRGTGRLEQRLIVNIDAIMRKGDLSETDPVIKAGDVIIVYGMPEGPVFFGY